jgi:hypothetical protein
MRRSQGLFAVVLWSLLAVACVGSKGLSSEEKERLKANVLDTAPADVQHKLDVNFEGKVHLIGYKLEPESAHPGQEVKLTYYWRCDDTLEEGWLLFTHTKDEASGKTGNLDYVGPLRDEKGGGHQVLGPERWEKGKVYVDQQTYRIPDDVHGDVGIYVGIWKGDARLRIVSGPNDGNDRALVAKINTGVIANAEEHRVNDVPSLVVNKLAASAKITIDGKADEPDWGGAVTTGAFVDVGTGKPNTSLPVNASAKLLWDAKNLYVFVQVRQTDFYTGFKDAKSQPENFTVAGQPKLWNKDSIEMIVDPDPTGESSDSYEIEINPQNKVYESQFGSRAPPSGDASGPSGHEDWDPKLKSAVQIQKGSDGKATGYDVEAAIPWAAYAKAANHPPKAGDVWRVNLYGIHSDAGVAWSPILGQGDFHKTSRFAKVTWAIAAPASAASASASASGVAGQ